MIDIKVTSITFDAAKIVREMDSKTRNALTQAGAFVRRTSRRSMRSRKSSAPTGSPPSAHNGALKNAVLFALDRGGKSVVIGPVRGRTGALGQMLEFGGDETVTKKFKDGSRQFVVKHTPHKFMGPAASAEFPQLASRWGEGGGGISY
jgi:hypothetical protein